MTLLHRLALIACASLCVSPAAAQAALQGNAWAQSRSDVKADPAILFGRLPNGMRYAILKNDTPAHQTSIRLAIGSGSMEERGDQQGLAHFLEHMAFKGSTHVPQGDMIKLLERRGLAFGPDTNAQTGFTQTVFMLDLPQSDPSTLDLGLMLMRETASELTLSQAAMDPERGVVLSEERLRDTPDYEALKQRLSFTYPGQLAPNRLPIGKAEVLKTAPVSLIRAYYSANYRPDRATLIVVGDIDPRTLESQIKAKFANWAPVGPETAEPEYGAVAQRGSQTLLVVQPGAHTALSMDWIKPFDPSVETEAKDRRRQIEQIAIAVLDRRLERAATGENPPFVSAGAGLNDGFRSARVASLSISPKPGGWKAALSAASHIQRQAADYGVTQAEVDREITELRTQVQNAADSAATRRTPELAQELVRTLDDNEVATSPAQDLARFTHNVDGLTAAEVSKTLTGIFEGQGPILSLTTPDPIDGGEPALAAAFHMARTDSVGLAAVDGAKTWPYASFGKPGVVVSRRDIADLGVTLVRFANGVRLNIKPTAFRKEQVLVNVRIGEGRLDAPSDRPTVRWAVGALALGGLGKISREDMQEVLAAKQYGLQASLTDDALVLGGATRPADLDTQLQVLAAQVSDPGFRPTAFARLQNAFANQLPQLDSTPQGVLGRELGKLEHSGDERWATPTEAEVKAAAPRALEQLLRPTLAAAPLEVVVVGDVTPDAVIAAVAKTFGALPARPGPHSPPPSALAIRFPKTGAAPVVLTHKGRADQSIAYQAWPTDGLFDDPQKARTLNVAAQVLELRLIDRVRIAEGSTYSPSVGSSPSGVFPTYGVVSASVETPPARIDGFYKAVRDITADLRAKGPTPDELERAVKPRIETLTKAQETNEYWMIWVSNADRDPRRLDIVRDTLPGYRRVTAAQVQAAAATYLTDAEAWRLEVTPRDIAAKAGAPAEPNKAAQGKAS